MRRRLLTLLSGLAVFALVAIGCGGGSSNQAASDFADQTCKNFQALAPVFRDVVADLQGTSSVSQIDVATKKKLSQALGSLDTGLGKLSAELNKEKSPSVKSGDDIKKQMVASIDKLRDITKKLRTKVDNFDPNADDSSSLASDFESFGSDFSSNADKFDSAFSDASELSKASQDSEVCKALNSQFSS